MVKLVTCYVDSTVIEFKKVRICSKGDGSGEVKTRISCCGGLFSCF